MLVRKCLAGNNGSSSSCRAVPAKPLSLLQIFARSVFSSVLYPDIDRDIFKDLAGWDNLYDAAREQKSQVPAANCIETLSRWFDNSALGGESVRSVVVWKDIAAHVHGKLGEMEKRVLYGIHVRALASVSEAAVAHKESVLELPLIHSAVRSSDITTFFPSESIYFMPPNDPAATTAKMMIVPEKMVLRNFSDGWLHMRLNDADAATQALQRLKRFLGVVFRSSSVDVCHALARRIFVLLSTEEKKVRRILAMLGSECLCLCTILTMLPCVLSVHFLHLVTVPACGSDHIQCRRAQGACDAERRGG